MSYFAVANDTLLYGLVALGMLYIIGLAVAFMVKAIRHADTLGIPKQTITNVIRSSAIFTIIPSVSVIIGLVSLSAVIGTPWSWFRLSVVGAVTYELTAAEMVSDALGFTSAGAMAAADNYKVFGAVMMVTSTCILGGILTNIFLAKRLSLGMKSYRSGKGDWGAIFNFSFAAALVAALIPYMLLNGGIYVAVLLVSIGVSTLLYYAASRFKIRWLPSFVMSAALIAGMAVAVLLTNILV